MKLKLILLLSVVLSGFTLVSAQEDTGETEEAVLDSALFPAPVSALRAYDTDNDHGHSITIEWELSADDGAGKNSVLKYEIYQALSADGPFKFVGQSVMGEKIFVNSGSKEREAQNYFPDFTDFYYRVDAVTVDSTIRTASIIVGPVQSSGQWFNTGRYPVFFAVLIFCFLTIYYVNRAKKGAKLYVRPLGGIEAVDIVNSKKAK
ncbi:MAG: DUF6754 domain-containing protein, partial [Candidatus Zixiibacteriota bacterium]